MTIFEFFALFSFSYILTITIGVFILGFIGVRKRKRAIKNIQSMSEKFNKGFNDLCE